MAYWNTKDVFPSSTATQTTKRLQRSSPELESLGAKSVPWFKGSPILYILGELISGMTLVIRGRAIYGLKQVQN